MTFSLGELATRFGCDLVGDPDARIEQVATLNTAGTGDIAFFVNEAYRSDLRQTGASAVIVRQRDIDDCPVAALVATDPYVVYARIASLLHPPPPDEPGVHSSAVVDPRARVAKTAHIGALACVGAGATIGESAYVGPGCIVGTRCVVGDGARLVAGVTLVDDVHVGRRSIIHPGVVIGGDGFGNARTAEGWLKVPQLGGVRIGDDVEIGSNTTVDRGAIGHTVIANGVRLDNLIQIAHNVIIGEHTAIASLVGIAGSVTIGKRCLIAGKAGFAGHIKVCDDAVIMGNAVISKDITEPGVYSGAFPAEKDRDWRRKVARFRRIEELVRRVENLEKANKKNE